MDDEYADEGLHYEMTSPSFREPAGPGKYESIAQNTSSPKTKKKDSSSEDLEAIASAAVAACAANSVVSVSI